MRPDFRKNSEKHSHVANLDGPAKRRDGIVTFSRRVLMGEKSREVQVDNGLSNIAIIQFLGIIDS